jgi:hypothetical protein
MKPQSVPLPAALLASDDSEVGQVLAQIIGHQAFPAEAVRDLRRLLSHDLARRHPGRLRYARLGLVMQMVNDRREQPNRFVRRSEYMQERERRLALGEQWPDESAIRAAYGPWPKVINAATQFAFKSSRGVSDSNHGHGFRRSYTPQEISTALLRCYFDLEAWPTEWEYEEWALIQRRMSAQELRLPGLKQIRNGFGDFHTALKDTRAAHERGRRGTACDSSDEAGADAPR